MTQKTLEAKTEDTTYRDLVKFILKPGSFMKMVNESKTPNVIERFPLYFPAGVFETARILIYATVIYKVGELAYNFLK